MAPEGKPHFCTDDCKPGASRDPPQPKGRESCSGHGSWASPGPGFRGRAAPALSLPHPPFHLPCKLPALALLAALCPAPSAPSSGLCDLPLPLCCHRATCFTPHLRGKRGWSSHPHQTGQGTEPEGWPCAPALGRTLASLAGLDSAAGAPVAPRKLRLAQTTVAVMAVTLVSSLVALIVVGKLLGDLNPTDSLCLPAKGPTHASRIPSAYRLPGAPGLTQILPGTPPRPRLRGVSQEQRAME